MIERVELKLNRKNPIRSQLIAYFQDGSYTIYNSSCYSILDNYLSEYLEDGKPLLRVVQQILCFEEDYMKLTEDQIFIKEIKDSNIFKSLDNPDPQPLDTFPNSTALGSVNELYITDENNIDTRIEYVADRKIWIANVYLDEVIVDDIKYLKLSEDRVDVVYADHDKTCNGSIYVQGCNGIYLGKGFFVLNNEAFQFNSTKDIINIDNILAKVEKYHTTSVKCRCLGKEIVKERFSNGKLLVKINDEIIAL